MTAQPPSRWQRLRRPALAVAAAVAIVLLIAAGLALRPDDSAVARERYWQAVTADLAAGRTVTLIGESGPPASWDWGGGKPGTILAAAAPAEFTASALDQCLLKLAPATCPPPYRIRGEVKQHGAAGHALAGLYFDHHQMGGPDVHSFFTATVAASGELSGPFRPGLPQLVRLHTRQQFLDLSYEPGLNGHSMLTAFSDIEPTGDGWLAIAIDVRPDRLVFSLNDRPVREVTRADMAQVPRAPGDAARLPAERTPTGAVGLYLQNCAAAFRRVTIEPYSGP
jgi:hypothetical protein